VEGFFTSFTWMENNNETLAIKVDGDIRSFRGLPIRDSVTRGTGGTLIIFYDVDDMTCGETMLIKFLLPLTGPTTPAILCTTVLATDPYWVETNWFFNYWELMSNHGFKYLNFVGSGKKD
jgi:hypothetical protein